MFYGKGKRKKSSSKAGNESEELIRLTTETMMEDGDRLGNNIIELIVLKEVDLVVLGTAVVGLAKALAMVMDIAKRTGIDVDKLYKGELKHFRRVFEKVEH